MRRPVGVVFAPTAQMMHALSHARQDIRLLCEKVGFVRNFGMPGEGKSERKNAVLKATQSIESMLRLHLDVNGYKVRQ